MKDIIIIAEKQAKDEGNLLALELGNNGPAFDVPLFTMGTDDIEFYICHTQTSTEIWNKIKSMAETKKAFKVYNMQAHKRQDIFDDLGVSKYPLTLE